MPSITPTSGIYENVPFEEYIAWEAINNGSLNLFRRSPLHFKRRPHRDTEAMSFGRFVHSGQFEPRTLIKNYCVIPDFNLADGNKTGDGKPSKSWSTEWAQNAKRDFLSANAGKDVVSQEQYERMLAICEAICADENANKFLNAPGGRSEVSIVWTCEITGLLCKARLDRVDDHGITDLKTCRDARWFESDMKRYSYHNQAAWYQYGWRVLTKKKLPFRFVAIEPEVPFAIRAAPVGDSSLEMGHIANDETVAELAACISKNEFPGYQSPEYFETAGLEEVVFNG